MIRNYLLKIKIVTFFLLGSNIEYSYSQLFANLNIGSGICSYELKDDWKEDYSTLGNDYKRIHILYGIGTSLLIAKKYQLALNCNYSYRKFNLVPIGGDGFWLYDTYYTGLIDFNCRFSYSILKFLIVGLMYQRSLYSQIEYVSSEKRIEDYKLNCKYVNNLFGYYLDFKYSNFNLSFQWLPHSDINGLKANNPADVFPFSKSKNFQMIFSYDIKLCNIKLPRLTNKVDCPTIEK